MKIEQQQDFERYDLALLALMAAEEICQQPLLHQGLAQLATLRREIGSQISACQNVTEKRELLLTLFYQKLGFKGNWQNYFISENNLLHQVLSERKGNALSLGILLIYLAKGCEIDAEGICFPEYFLVRFNDGQDSVIVDPLNGQRLEHHELELRLRGAQGNLAQLKEEHLQATDQRLIVERLLGQLKTAFIREDKVVEALHCSELFLRLNPGDPYEVRDRGFLYERLDCGQLAADDFEYFIKECPDDPVAEILKQQIERLDRQQKTLH
nr:tetratricopeptide repeat protein [Dongshaea marina]